MNDRDRLGGVIHTYQRYDPQRFPSPTQPPPDLVSPAFEHMLMYGSMRRLTEEELARAVRIDPGQIAGLGPSLDMLRAMLLERKRRILETYESKTVRELAKKEFANLARQMAPPKQLRKDFAAAVRDEQIYDLERLWYRSGDEQSPFARQLLHLAERLGDKYQVDELAAKYTFTGAQRMSIPKAIEVKEELETIDKLLKQLEEAAKTAQIGVIDMEDLERFVQPEQIEQLSDLQRRVQELLRELAERQGLEQSAAGFRLTPKAYRIFQSRLLERIFADMQASRTGRHGGPVVGEGAVELERTKPYEFGDSIANLDIPGSIINAMIRDPDSRPIRFRTEDLLVHKTRNCPKAATVVVLDMSGSMRYDGQYLNVKRMGLALDGLIRSEFPGDYLQFIEAYSFAKPRHSSEIASLMPKPVTIFDPWVNLWEDMSDPNTSEFDVPPHFTNLQHGLQLARKFLSQRDTPNRQIILISDGLPTAHFEGKILRLMYPPNPITEAATMREGQLCMREGIIINFFLLPSWNQSIEDVRFARNLAESTKGRIFFTAGRDLDRYVVWDYLHRRKDMYS